MDTGFFVMRELQWQNSVTARGRVVIFIPQIRDEILFVQGEGRMGFCRNDRRPGSLAKITCLKKYVAMNYSHD
jgi:hypothetical protein